MEHEPVELRASPEALAALSGAITGYRVERFPGDRDVNAVWIEAGQLYLVSVDIAGLAFKFEAFRLVVQAPAEALAAMEANRPLMEKGWAEVRAAGIALPQFPPPAEPAPTGALEKWPFASWRLDILRRMEFIIGPDHLPDGTEAQAAYFHDLPRGEAPGGSEHHCLTAIGLLFTADDGRRFLIAADGMPGFMRVTDEEEVVQAYLRQCIADPATDSPSGR
jgi:hypothetical protein